MGVGANAWSCGKYRACERDLEQYCVSSFPASQQISRFLMSVAYSRILLKGIALSIETDREAGADTRILLGSTRGEDVIPSMKETSS